MARRHRMKSGLAAFLFAQAFLAMGQEESHWEVDSISSGERYKASMHGCNMAPGDFIVGVMA